MSRGRDPLWGRDDGLRLVPQCGEESVRRHQPGWWKRLRYWLVNGAPDTLICPNGHPWAMTFGVVLVLGGATRPKWVRIPVQVFRVIHSGRSMVPTPRTHLMAVGFGLILGSVVDLIVGWTWWAIAVAFVLLVWLIFLASAFKGSHDIGQHLLRVIDPEKAARRDFQRFEDALASGSLAGHEVVNWVREKSIGAWGRGATPESLTIRHGERSDPEWIEVTTHGGDAADTMAHRVREDLERELVEAQFPFPPRPTIEDFQCRRQHIQEAQTPEWESVSFRIGDEMVPGRSPGLGADGAGIVRPGAVAVEMTGAGIDPGQLHLSPIVTLDRSTKRGE